MGQVRPIGDGVEDITAVLKRGVVTAREECVQ
jgi:hypothetical protein